jgi:hypothetical protein
MRGTYIAVNVEGEVMAYTVDGTSTVSSDQVCKDVCELLLEETGSPATVVLFVSADKYSMPPAIPMVVV